MSSIEKKRKIDCVYEAPTLKDLEISHFLCSAGPTIIDVEHPFSPSGEIEEEG